MEYTQDVELILSSLSKDRKELADKLNDIDKLIKRVKTGAIDLGGTRALITNNNYEDANVIELVQPFPLKADLKVQIIKIFDILGVASKLKEVQDKYHELTGFNNNIRETVRTLNKHDILKLLQNKGSNRGLYWVKTDWLDNNGTTLQDKFKFEGFDLLFSNDMIEFK